VESRNKICPDCNLRIPTLYVNKSWDQLNRDDYRRRRLIEIRGHRCEICGIEKWLGQAAPVEIDHTDGNHFNNDLSNVRVLCLMCHAQTPTYRGRNKKQKRDVG